jgi:hypothetical protein
VLAGGSSGLFAPSLLLEKRRQKRPLRSKDKAQIAELEPRLRITVLLLSVYLFMYVVIKFEI